MGDGDTTKGDRRVTFLMVTYMSPMSPSSL